MPARLTDEDIDSLWNEAYPSSKMYTVRDANPQRVHRHAFARRIERIVAERERQRAHEIAKWHVQCAAKNGGLDDEDVRECAKEIADAILRDDGAGDDKEEA